MFDQQRLVTQAHVGQVGYWLWLLVVLVVVAVVRHRRFGPSSSTMTSTVDRALPSSAVHARCWSWPRTTTRLLLGQRLGDMLGLVAPHNHGEERRLLLPPARHRHPEHGPGDPAPACRNSGSSVRLPAKLTLASVMVHPPRTVWPGGSPVLVEPRTGGCRHAERLPGASDGINEVGHARDRRLGTVGARAGRGPRSAAGGRGGCARPPGPRSCRGPGPASGRWCGWARLCPEGTQPIDHQPVCELDQPVRIGRGDDDLTYLIGCWGHPAPSARQPAPGLVLGPGHAAPAGDDVAVVAEPGLHRPVAWMCRGCMTKYMVPLERTEPSLAAYQPMRISLSRRRSSPRHR